MATGIQRKAILALGVVVFAAMLGGGALRGAARRAQRRDLDGATTRIGTAIVAAPIVQGHDPVGKARAPWALVRFGGRVYTVTRVRGPDGLHVDRAARIEYRVGHSGRVYVDQIEPLPNPERPAHP